MYVPVTLKITILQTSTIAMITLLKSVHNQDDFKI